MTEISPSIWQQNENGDWRLYFNSESEMSNISGNNNDKIKTKKNYLTSSQQNLILGTLVMTSKGIGRLIKIIENHGIIKFKNDNKEEKIPLNEITNTFNCFIHIYSNGVNIIRLKMKVLGKVGDIFEELEKSKKLNIIEYNNLLVYNGMSLNNEQTFEQLNVKNNCKFLLINNYIVKYTISRFLNVSQFWFTYTIDGICFSPSQKIKLIGIGLYGSHENKIMQATMKILDGPSISSNVIYEENIEVAPGISKFNPISPIMFSKAITCKQNQDYSVLLLTRTTSNCYYGQQGKSLIEGEKGVTFTFKKIVGRNSGSSIESGNFPEFYYYLY
jgi:hypothetical protein